MILCKKNRSLLQLIATGNRNTALKCNLKTTGAGLGVMNREKVSFQPQNKARGVNEKEAKRHGEDVKQGDRSVQVIKPGYSAELQVCLNQEKEEEEEVGQSSASDPN